MSEKTKKVSYANLLKEALSDFTEIPKNVDTVGPFLDPILSYKGDGELPTHKDAASILERYYFEQDQDKGVTVALDEEESVVDKDIVTVGDDKAALSDEPDSVKKSKDDTEDAMAMEQEEMVADEEEETEEVEEQIVPEEPAGLAGDEKELPPRKGKDADNQVKAAQLEADDTVESAVIEKLISEMEDEEDEVEEEVDDEVVEEQEEKEEEKEDEDELDVDKEMEGEEEKEEEEQVTEDAGVGPGPIKAKGAMGNPGEGEDYDDIDEAFNIFKEQIEEDVEVPEVDSEDVVV